MQYKVFLIKYAEIGIKGKNRYLFEDMLLHQIKNMLKTVEGDFSVYKTQGRVFVEAGSEYDYEELTDALTRVFGITQIAPVLVSEEKNFDSLCELAVEYLKKEYPDETASFKVNCRRADKGFLLNSQEVNVALGEKLLEKFPKLSVDVHDPDILLTVEIRERIFVYAKTIKGSGGMPVGTGGKAMLLLSGGIDSPVAGYMIAKRGVKIDAVYFHAPPYTSERAKQKVVDLAKIVSKYTGPIYLHVINFTDIQLYIYEKCPHDELTIIMRRYMMRIAERLAKENECLGLITGESIGQVASQTLNSLAATNEVCELPVYRPLIAFDKQEIIEISQRIGTFETSILPYEDCCTIFVAKHPVTKPNVGVIRKHEHNLDEKIEELVNTALEMDEVIIVR